MVARDDLADGGASVFADTIRRLRDACPEMGVEVLIPDFNGEEAPLRTVMSAGPDILNHNVETVPRLYDAVRPKAVFRRSVDLLARVKARHPSMTTKSGLMLGLGERDDEVLELLRALRAAGVDVVTVGQYLRPSAWNLPVVEYATPVIPVKCSLSDPRGLPSRARIASVFFTTT